MRTVLHNNLTQIRKLYGLLAPREHKRLYWLLGMMVLAVFLEVAGIGMIPAFVTLITDYESVTSYSFVREWVSWWGIEGQKDLLVLGALLLIGVFLAKNGFLVLFYRYQNRFIYDCHYQLSSRLMRAYMQAPYTFHLGRNSSELLRNTTQEVNHLVGQFLAPLLELGMVGILVLSILVFLLVIEPLLTVAVFVFLGLIAGVFLTFTARKSKVYGKKAQVHRQGMIKALSQGLGGFKDARVLNRSDFFINDFNREAYGNFRAHEYKAFVTQIPKPLIETLAVTGMLLIALLMVWQGRMVNNIIPVLTLFGMATMRLMPTVQQIMSIVTQLRYSKVAVDPVKNDMDALKAYVDPTDLSQATPVKWPVDNEIQVSNLAYQYPQSKEKSLKGVTLRVPKGHAVAITGPSGGGKTTLADHLMGLLEPQEGNVFVDGRPISDNLSAWQHNIGYIPQFIYLADETLRKNIAFGVPSEAIDDERVLRCIQMAQLEDWLGQWPQGLDTIVGERGARLSGGQRQRVGIARALYHDPQVLVMDEATSALDHLTEQKVLESIEQLRGERTIIMIAHRLSTVRNCDNIYVLKQGTIAGSGSYGELIGHNEEFMKLAAG